LAVALALVVLVAAGTMAARQASSLADNLPGYQAAITEKLSRLQASGGFVDRVSATLNGMGQSLRRELRPADGPPGDIPAARPGVPTRPAAPAEAGAAERSPVPVVIHEPEPTTLQTLQRVAGPLLHPLATGGIVVILVIFILLYREDLRDRLIRLAGAHDLHRTMAAMDDAAYRLSRFFLAQVGMNTAFGVFIAAMLWLIGIPNPLLWGFVAGLMRFVPFIGSYIAAAFPVLLSIAVDPGWTTFLLVVALFAVGEISMGQVFEPWIFGQSTGLSPIAVIAAATFWTWLWGAIGLLLAVPLTVCLVVLGRHVEQLEFLEVMLGDQPALAPEETFYQRALAGDLDALEDQAERFLKEDGVEAYLDSVALPALHLAQADASRGALAPERMARLRESVLALLEDLDDGMPAQAESGAADGEPAPTVPAAWQAPGTVLCLGGRGPFDALLAAVLAQALSWRGFGVQQAPAATGALPAGAPRLACLCLLEGGSSGAAARYLLRRTRRRLADASILGLVWRGESIGEERLASALRTESGSVPVPLATGIAEACDMILEAAQAEAAATGDAGAVRPAAAERTVGETAIPALPVQGAAPA
ncbi:MAG: AI-2E family transporter, partial [Acetobacteraceae bacterium]|nr:AI-2E family transporter [Acetobacteraceae bacterium]